MRDDPLGDRMKEYEQMEAGRKTLPRLPVIARLDGRNFSAFTLPTMSGWSGNQAVEVTDRAKVVPLLRRFAGAGRGVKHLPIEILNGTGKTGLAAEWRDKVDDWDLDFDTPVEIGENSSIEELKCLLAE